MICMCGLISVKLENLCREYVLWSLYVQVEHEDDYGRWQGGPGLGWGNPRFRRSRMSRGGWAHAGVCGDQRWVHDAWRSYGRCSPKDFDAWGVMEGVSYLKGLEILENPCLEGFQVPWFTEEIGFYVVLLRTRFRTLAYKKEGEAQSLGWLFEDGFWEFFWSSRARVWGVLLGHFVATRSWFRNKVWIYSKEW